MTEPPMKIRHMDIEITRKEWSCLRILFPKKVLHHTEECTLERGDMNHIEKVIGNMDEETALFGRQLRTIVEAEDALVIIISKEGIPADAPPQEE
jgi:hypothetical protein